MMFFTLNIMENIRYFNTKISHFNYIFKIIQYIKYYCRILCHWWASAGAGVIVVIITVVVSGHLQLPVLLSASIGSCRCRCGHCCWLHICSYRCCHRCWSAPAGGVTVVLWHLQLQVVLPSASVGSCRCRWGRRCPLAPAAAGGVAVILWHLQLQVLPSSSMGICRGVVAVVIGGGGCVGGGCESRTLKFRIRNFNIVTSSVT